MEYIFLFIFLLTPFLVVSGLIKPTVFSKILKRNATRKKIALIGLMSFVGSFIGVGLTADTSKINTDNTDIEERQTEEFPPIIETEVSSISMDTENVSIAKVLRIIDGDTIEVSLEAKNERVRVIGIDTPETVDPRKSVECFGAEASNKAKELLKIGNEVYLEREPSQDNRDRYSRLLRYVWINENLDFGKLMIEQGYAYEYTYQLPYKYQSIYKNAQKSAEEEKRGLWADDICVAAPSPTSVQAVKPTVTPTPKPTNTPAIYTAPTSTPTTIVNPTTAPDTSGSWVCDCSKTCTQITTCDEAYYQLNVCGCKIRDRDNDGVPCENICPGG